jgi:hypothetical protein
VINGLPLFIEDQTPTYAPGDYSKRAEACVRRVTDLLLHPNVTDPAALSEAAHRALVADANAGIRQILAQLTNEIALARALCPADPAMRSALGGFQRGVDQLARITDAYLDWDRGTAMVVRLEPEEFDLSAALTHRLHRTGILKPGPPEGPSAPIVLLGGSARVRADKEKVLDVLEHLAMRFHFAASRGERLVVATGVREGCAEVFIGVRASNVSAEELMMELSRPLVLEESRIDVPYARALVERLGGTLSVSTDGQAAESVGFRASLPLSEVAS